MPTLNLRRLRTVALEAFKILNNQGPVYLHDLLNFKNQNYSFSRNPKGKNFQVMASALSTTVQLNYGTPYPSILEIKLILMILKVLSVPGMERVVPVLFVLQNSFAFYLTCIDIFHVLLIACYVLFLLCFVALPYFT